MSANNISDDVFDRLEEIVEKTVCYHVNFQYETVTKHLKEQLEREMSKLADALKAHLVYELTCSIEEAKKNEQSI